MTTFVWGTTVGGSGLSGDWNTATLWAGGIVPDSASAAVLINAPGSYSITIAAGETEIVNTLTLTGEATDLTVDGTLEFAGPLPTSSFVGTIPLIVGATGDIEGTGQFSAGGLLNAGTIHANGGPNDFLEILNTVTNNNVLLADNGNLVVSALDNLRNGTLTGGTYVAYGINPTDAAPIPVNNLEIGQGSGPGVTVDAADIVLDGQAAAFQLFNTTGTFTALEQELGSIAVTGTLALLDDYDYVTGNTLTDSGLIVLGGGTLSTGGLTIAAGGTLSAYGTVEGASFNSGVIIANGGSLGITQFQNAILGAGTLSVATGSEVVMTGATLAGLTDNGVIYDSGSVSITGNFSGSGTILVESGRLEFDNATSATVAFAGSGVTIALDSPSQFHGTVAGFEAGDTLLLKGISATSAKIVHNNTLALIANGVTVDKLVLAGNYTGASFQAVSSGGSTTVTSLSGAPIRDGIGIETIAVTNTIGLSNSLVAAIENDLSFAVSEWGQYITGAAPLRISLSFTNSGQFGSELAVGSPGGLIATGETVDGHAIFIPDSVYALETGDYASGFSTDIAITVVASTANLANFYINPNPSASTTVPLGKLDLISVLEHEVGHGLGFTGLINRFAPVAGSPPIFAGAAADPYDMLVSYGTAGATFDGANAEAAYGAMINAGSPTPVPLYLATDSSLDTENFYHVASIAALSGDVMNVAMPAGTFLPVSALDLAILKDTGVPVTSSVNCFVRGTRILTDCGYISIETLRAGDVVVTHDGSAQPIVWIGCRMIDCRHHPTPDRVYPVCIAAHAFGDNLPERPLLVSPEHAVYFDDVLIPVRLLEDGVLVRRVPCSTVEYYHLELACHDIVFAEGLPAETYLDCGDRGNFANSDGAVRLFPDFAVFPPSDVWEARGCAPLCLTGSSLAAARALLRRRGEGRAGSWFERVNQA